MPTRPVEVPLALFEAVAVIELELEPVPTGIPLLAAEVVVMLALREGADTACEDELVPTRPVEVPFALFEAVAEIDVEAEPVPTGIPLLLEEVALAELTSVGVWLVMELADTAAEDDVVATVEELVPVPGIVLFIDMVEDRVGLIGSAVLVLDGPALLIEDEDEDEPRLLEVAATDEDGEELTLLDEVVDGEAELVLDEVVDGEAELELDEAELELLEVVETTDELELGEIAAASPQSPKSESQFLPQ